MTPVKDDKNNIYQPFWELFFKNADTESKSSVFYEAKVKKGHPRYLGMHFGIGGMLFAVCVLKNESWVELCIQKSKEESSKIFNDFFSNRSKIEEIFSEPLEWFPNNENTKKRCRIASEKIRIGINDEKKWTILQEKLIDKMSRLKSALSGYGYF